MTLQMLLNALLNAALIAPPAIAFTLIFAVLRFPNFAVGGLITVGAYAAWTANVPLGLPLALAVLVGMAATAGVALACDRVVFAPLRRSDSITLLVVSIALALVLENIVRFAYGNDLRGFDLPLTRPMTWGGLSATVEQLWVLAGGVAIAAAMHALLAHTRLGKAMRAVADNPALAAARGIRTGRVIAATWAIAGALLGAAGVMAGLDLVIEPLTGWQLTIPILAAAILGGIGSPYGAMLGAVVVGLAEELTVLILPSTYKVAVSFAIIAVLLLVRPQGLFGTPAVKK